MSKHNGIKIFVKVNGSSAKDDEASQKKALESYEAQLNKVSINAIFTDRTENQDIFTELSHFNSAEDDNAIFTFINLTNDASLFFHEGENSIKKSSEKEKGIINIFAESIIHESYGAKIYIKVLEFPSFNNIIGDFSPMDEEGYVETASISTIKNLFKFVSQNHSQTAMMIILKGGLTKFNFLYYPIESQGEVSELCNNFYSQKFVISNYFKHIKPTKFCFFWNVLEASLPGISQLIMILQSGKGDRAVIQNAKKEMQRLQAMYKRFNQKSRKILNILSKCIDLENAQIDKKSLLYVDCLPSSQKPSDKLKISAIRKSQNDEQIEQLQKDVSNLQSEISLIKQNHRQKMMQHQNILSQKQDQKGKLWRVYQNFINPKVKIDHTNNHNLYWRPTQSKLEKESELIQDGFNQHSTYTKNIINSHKNLTKKNIQTKLINNEAKKSIQFDLENQNDESPVRNIDKKAQEIRQEQIKFEIQTLFSFIGEQEKMIQTVLLEGGHRIKTSTINKIKNRQQQLLINPDLIHECLSKAYSQDKYTNWIRQEKCFQKFQKQLRQRQMAAQTLTTIRDI